MLSDFETAVSEEAGERLYISLRQGAGNLIIKGYNN